MDGTVGSGGCFVWLLCVFRSCERCWVIYSFFLVILLEDEEPCGLYLSEGFDSSEKVLHILSGHYRQ